MPALWDNSLPVAFPSWHMGGQEGMLCLHWAFHKTTWEGWKLTQSHAAKYNLLQMGIWAESELFQLSNL